MAWGLGFRNAHQLFKESGIWSLHSERKVGMLNIQYLEEPEMCHLHEHKQVVDGSTIHTPVFSPANCHKTKNLLKWLYNPFCISWLEWIAESHLLLMVLLQLMLEELFMTWSSFNILTHVSSFSLSCSHADADRCNVWILSISEASKLEKLFGKFPSHRSSNMLQCHQARVFSYILPNSSVWRKHVHIRFVATGIFSEELPLNASWYASRTREKLCNGGILPFYLKQFTRVVWASIGVQHYLRKKQFGVEVKLGRDDQQHKKQQHEPYESPKGKQTSRRASWQPRPSQRRWWWWWSPWLHLVATLVVLKGTAASASSFFTSSFPAQVSRSCSELAYNLSNYATISPRFVWLCELFFFWLASWRRENLEGIAAPGFWFRISIP